MFILELRKKYNMTQKELAKKLGVGASCISNYENGVREPSILILIKLSEIFHCTIDELVRGVK